MLVKKNGADLVGHGRASQEQHSTRWNANRLPTMPEPTELTARKHITRVNLAFKASIPTLLASLKGPVELYGLHFKLFVNAK